MKHSRCPAISTIVAATAAFGLAGALAADPGRGSAAPATQLPGRQLQAAPLQGEMRLNPGAVNSGGARLAMPKTSIEALTQKFNELSGKAKGYESMAKAVPNIAQECAAKAYSVQDQKAAGCAASDTLAQCSDKLLKHCIENYSNRSTLPTYGPATGGNWNSPGGRAGSITIGFSVKEFQQTAQAAAADARALSQLLNLYASQVEQNTKALLP